MDHASVLFPLLPGVLPVAGPFAAAVGGPDVRVPRSVASGVVTGCSVWPPVNDDPQVPSPPVLAPTRRASARQGPGRLGGPTEQELPRARPDLRAATHRPRPGRAAGRRRGHRLGGLPAGRTGRRRRRGGRARARCWSRSPRRSGRPPPAATRRSQRWSGSALGDAAGARAVDRRRRRPARRRGAQTLLPSVEAAYPWVLALLGTSLFAGFGIARRVLGEAAMRRRRLRGVPSRRSSRSWPGPAFAARRDGQRARPPRSRRRSSRFGPTTRRATRRSATARWRIGTSARLELHLTATSTAGRSAASTSPATRVRRRRPLAGLRRDERRSSARRRGPDRRPRRGSACRSAAGAGATPAEVADGTVDLKAFATALRPEARAAAESVASTSSKAHGPAVPDRDRRPDVPAGVPAGRLARRRRRARPLAGRARLLGLPGRPDRPDRPAASTATRRGIAPTARSRRTIRVDLTATDRGSPVTVTPPAP